MFQILKVIALWLWNQFQEWQQFAMDAVYNRMISLFDVIMSKIPPDLVPDFGPFLLYLKLANHWFPIAEAFLLWSALFVFWTFFVLLKIVAKCIPTVG